MQTTSRKPVKKTVDKKVGDMTVGELKELIKDVYLRRWLGLAGVIVVVMMMGGGLYGNSVIATEGDS